MENVPLTLSHYRLGKTLGIGAFGKVKLAVHTITGQKVAVKILNKGKIKHMEMAEKVRREINILKMCTHPHIIRLYEVIDTPSDIFMVMEYVPGGELFDHIVSRGRLPPDDARQFFHQIVTGVEYCHYHGIVHRDLKPENLLLDADNNIKIADFGLSNVIHDGYFLRSSCGSPNYAAPEVISGALYAGPEVDVWSCGVILYALLCGTLPFDDESIPNLFKKIKSGMYSLPSHLSQLSRDLILRMLVVDPMKRISIPEIRQHAWFQHRLPQYLSLPPDMIEQQERYVDEETVELVSQMQFPNCNAESVMAAVKGESNRMDLLVAYNLVLDAKRHKLRIADVVMALQDPSRTPPPASPRLRTPVSGSPPARDDIPRGRPAIGGQGDPTRQAQAQGAGGQQAKKRRWYLGIQSKKNPAHVMTEVYKALNLLGCQWKAITNYRILCLWRPQRQTPSVFNFGGSTTPWGADQSQTGVHSMDDVEMELEVPTQSRRNMSRNDGEEWKIKVGLSLYKVQQGIFLLDFQKVQGDPFSFMQLCSHIITELKTLSAASRQVTPFSASASADMMGGSAPMLTMPSITGTGAGMVPMGASMGLPPRQTRAQEFK